MERVKKYIGIMLAVSFLFNAVIPSVLFGQDAVLVMTLPDGRAIRMIPAQLTSLAAQPGITIKATPIVGATEVAIPIPTALGGFYIVGTPGAIASGLGATGIAVGVKASAIIGATAAAGATRAGSLAGIVAKLGVAGTVTLGGIILGAAIAGIIAAVGGGEEAVTAPAHH